MAEQRNRASHLAFSQTGQGKKMQPTDRSQFNAQLKNSGLPTILLAAFLLEGCAIVEQPLQSNLGSASGEVRACANWYKKLDATIDQSGVRDGGAHRIPGFPYLRIDRFLASYREQARKSDQGFDAWIARLRTLDAEAREYELKNLPEPQASRNLGDKVSAKMRTDQCAGLLAHVDFTSPAIREQLMAKAEVPDDYSDINRTVGLYPLLRIPFSARVDNWQREAIEMFRSTGADTQASYVRYVPSGAIADAKQIQAILESFVNDALGIPQFDADAQEILFQTYAPVLEIETTGEFDRIGPLTWNGEKSPMIQVFQPLVYRRLALTRYRGRNLVQLVYTAWFPQRPREGAFDLFTGRLDGLVFRVTLDNRGQPLLYDTIHPCGCYHMFLPTHRVEALPAPDPDSEWAFIPKNAPMLKDSQRLALRIATRTHYLVDLHPDDGGSGNVYGLVDDNELRGLPYGLSGATRSSFGPDGIVPGTERTERFLFWPMGIAKAGAMRQWGRHATAFIGRRHFDDADLVEKRFKIRPLAQ